MFGNGIWTVVQYVFTPHTPYSVPTIMCYTATSRNVDFQMIIIQSNVDDIVDLCHLDM